MASALCQPGRDRNLLAGSASFVSIMLAGSAPAATRTEAEIVAGSEDFRRGGGLAPAQIAESVFV